MTTLSGRRPWTIAAAALLFVLGGCARQQEARELNAGDVVAASPTESAAALCEHGVPAEVCTRCNPDLVAVFKELGDWCDEHGGLPRSQCRACNPTLDFSKPAAPKDWCREHAVPESMCTKCHPELVAQFIAAGDYCREHGYPKSGCPRCYPERVTARGEALPTVPPPGTKVRLASAGTAREAGIESLPVERRRFAETIQVVGRLDFDQDHLAQVSSAVDATIVEVKVDVGDEVAQGDPLVVLASAAVGEEQGRLSAARARVETASAALAREQSLFAKGISARKQVDRARSELAAARAQYDAALASLRVAGASPHTSGGRHILTAPLSGTVVARDAVAGRGVSPGQMLIQVADVVTMWALLQVPEAQAPKLRPGQPVILSFEGLQNEERRASVSRVAASVDPATRTVRVRVDVPNPDRSLKAGVFVRARIEVSDERDALVVPREAVEYAEGQPIVFVRESETVYLPVPVELGGTTDGRIEIRGGLDPGARVVTTGAFLLKTEILKESIGAGCCEEPGE